MSHLRRASEQPGARELLIWLALALVFAMHYVVKTHVGPDSSIAAHASLGIAPPFVFRLLLPWTLSRVLPITWLDLEVTRITVATLFVFASLWLMPAFVARVTRLPLHNGDAQRTRWALLIMLIAHYSLPRNLKFYYVYDFPAITFYQITLLTLTSATPRNRWLGVLLAAVFASNRETVGVAVVHTLAWHLTAARTGGPTRSDSRTMDLVPVMLAGFAVFLVRKLISAKLGHPVQASFSWMEGDQLRLLANLERMATKHHHGIALLWFGAGAIIWLPKRWSGLPPPLQHLLIASAPVFVFYCIVGNFVELRMFSELLPLLAAALAFKAPTSQTQTPGCA